MNTKKGHKGSGGKKPLGVIGIGKGRGIGKGIAITRGRAIFKG